MSRCKGDCDKCEYNKPLPSISYFADPRDPDPAFFCAIYDSVPYDEGYKDGYQEALNDMREEYERMLRHVIGEVYERRFKHEDRTGEQQ